MTTKTFHTQKTPAGDIVIYADDDGLFLQVTNGQEGLDLPMTVADFDELRHGIIKHDDAMKAVEDFLPELDSNSGEVVDPVCGLEDDIGFAP